MAGIENEVRVADFEQGRITIIAVDVQVIAAKEKEIVLNYVTDMDLAMVVENGKCKIEESTTCGLKCRVRLNIVLNTRRLYI